MSSYLHCIITRFSFRFREDQSILPLLSDERLNERISIFKNYCFPSIINQINPNFYWILIIDPMLPNEYRDRLLELIREFKESDLYQTRGPRDIWLYTWDWQRDDRLGQGKIEWILSHFNQNPEWKEPTYLITTRLDDDDSLVDNFTKLVKDHITKAPKITNFRYLSYCIGYQFYSKTLSLKKTRAPMIALGLTLITVIKKWPICVYLGSHTKIPVYIKKPETNEVMFNLSKKNKDLPITNQKIMDRLLLIRTGNPIYVRNVHDFNLQKNIGKHNAKTSNTKLVKDILRKNFHVTID